jgi:RNA polymerase sigma factor (sigma-70 family)
MRAAVADIEAPAPVAAMLRELPYRLDTPGEDRADVMLALSSLELDQRRVVFLRYALGLSWDAVAKAVGLSRKAVRRRERLALARLTERGV